MGRDFPSSHGVWCQIVMRGWKILPWKRENQQGKTRGHMGRREHGMGFNTHRGPVTCMWASMGFVVGVLRVVFGVIVGPVLGACIPVISKLILGCVATEPPKSHIHHFWPAGHNSLGGNSCCWRVIHLDRTFRLGWTHGDKGLAAGIISRPVMKSAASSDLAAEAMTNLMIWAIDRMAPLNNGNGPFSERQMQASALLQELVLLWKPASAWAQSIMLLAW